MVTKIKQIQNRKGFLSLRLNVSWKLTRPLLVFNLVEFFVLKIDLPFTLIPQCTRSWNVQLIPVYVGEEGLKYILPRKNKNRSVKYPTLGPTKTIKSPPRTLTRSVIRHNCQHGSSLRWNFNLTWTMNKILAKRTTNLHNATSSLTHQQSLQHQASIDPPRNRESRF